MQVPIFHVLRKFDGEAVTDDIRAGRRRFRITRLPRYLPLHFRRFTKNNFFVEKNPTLVNFPVKVNEDVTNHYSLRCWQPGSFVPEIAGIAATRTPHSSTSQSR